MCGPVVLPNRWNVLSAYAKGVWITNAAWAAWKTSSSCSAGA